MKGYLARGVGVLLLLSSGGWAIGAARDLSLVSPIHWPLVLPQMLLGFVPALFSALLAGALIFGRPGVRALTFALGVTLLQGLLVRRLAPDLHTRYQVTVEQGQESTPQ